MTTLEGAQYYLDTELPNASSSIDRAEVIQEAINQVPLAKVDIRIGGIPKLVFPFREEGWEIGETIIVDKSMTLDLNGTALILSGNCDGIEIHPAGQWAKIARGTIMGKTHSGLGTGVRIRANSVTLEDVVCRELGTGFEIYGVGSDNANAFRMSRCDVFNCSEIGLHIKGGDTNGGYVDSLVLNNISGIGILDESFLGNTFVGTMLHTITHEAIVILVSANYSTYIGTYMEADCGSALPNGIDGTIISQPLVTWLGGGVIPYVKTGDRVGLSVSKLGFYDKMPNGDAIRIRMPHGEIEAPVTIQRENEAGQVIERIDAFKWVDNLKQVGHVVSTGTGYTGNKPVAANGLTRPVGWTSSKHSDGLGKAKVDAEHYTIGSPVGHSVQHSGSQ